MIINPKTSNTDEPERWQLDDWTLCKRALEPGEVVRKQHLFTKEMDEYLVMGVDWTRDLIGGTLKLQNTTTKSDMNRADIPFWVKNTGEVEYYHEGTEIYVRKEDADKPNPSG